MQATYCIEKLGLDTDKVNVNGGAIAIGHPLGCTGSKLTATLLHEMKRRGRGSARFGVVSMCIGSGMGAAAVFEVGCAACAGQGVAPRTGWRPLSSSNTALKAGPASQRCHRPSVLMSQAPADKTASKPHAWSSLAMQQSCERIGEATKGRVQPCQTEPRCYLHNTWHKRQQEPWPGSQSTMQIHSSLADDHGL